MNKLFSKTRKYAFFLIKRDGKYLLIYLVALCSLVISQAVSFAELYASATKRAAGAITMNNPAMVAISGPVYKTISKGFSLGALMSNQTLLYTAVIVAVVNIIFVTRNTRSDEESSRIELLKSLPIGRLTNYIATVLIIFLLNFLTFIILGYGLNALNIESMDFSGSMLYGLILAVTGLFFSSLTMLLSNFFISTKNVYGVSFLFLGVSYVVRAIGDLNKNDITLFSPLGWVIRSRVYTKNNWSFSVLLIVLSILLFSLSLFLVSKRDTGGTVIMLKNKRTSNSKLLRTPFGFFVRLLRSNIFIWAVVIAFFGAIYGFLLNNIDDFMKSIAYLTPNYAKGDAIKEYITAIFPFLAIIITIPVIISTKKAFEEEHSNRLEIIYSKSVQKIYPLSSTILIATGQAILNLLILFISFWGTARYGVNCNISYLMVLKTSMMFLPAILIFISLIGILTGVLPKLVNTIWLYYVYTIFVIIFGKTLKLSHLLLKISPFGWISKYPINDLNINHQILLYGVSILLILLGFWEYRRRDKLRF